MMMMTMMFSVKVKEFSFANDVNVIDDVDDDSDDDDDDNFSQSQRGCQ